jgi:hypothetical protein
VAISTPVQWFFAGRIYKITKSYLIPGIVVALSLASSAGGFITGIKIAVLKLFIKKPELHWSALLWFLTSCVADLLITGTLVRSLSQRKTGVGATDTMIDKLIRLTVKTGMITAICAIGDVAFFMALPHTGVNFLWDLTLSKLYTNCLMSNLNARSSLLSDFHNGFSEVSINPGSIEGRRPLDFTFDRTSHSIMTAPQVHALDD